MLTVDAWFICRTYFHYDVTRVRDVLEITIRFIYCMFYFESSIDWRWSRIFVCMHANCQTIVILQLSTKLYPLMIKDHDLVRHKSVFSENSFRFYFTFWYVDVYIIMYMADKATISLNSRIVIICNNPAILQGGFQSKMKGGFNHMSPFKKI